MASDKRWKQAQSSEKSFWEVLARRIEKDNKQELSWYRWRAENLKRLVNKAISGSSFSLSSATVLEIGSGPVGVTSFLEAGECIAIDPLCDYYTLQPALVKYRDNNVQYKTGIGESLPFADAFCDLVVIENVIDHVQDAHAVMKEIGRVLKPGGILYLTINLHPAWGAILHWIISRLKIDKGHPYTFTLGKIRHFLAEHGFRILHDEWQDFKECRANDLRSRLVKEKLKGITGLSEFLFSSVSVWSG